MNSVFENAVNTFIDQTELAQETEIASDENKYTQNQLALVKFIDYNNAKIVEIMRRHFRQYLDQSNIDILPSGLNYTPALPIKINDYIIFAVVAKKLLIKNKQSLQCWKVLSSVANKLDRRDILDVFVELTLT